MGTDAAPAHQQPVERIDHVALGRAAARATPRPGRSEPCSANAASIAARSIHSTEKRRSSGHGEPARDLEHVLGRQRDPDDAQPLPATADDRIDRVTRARARGRWRTARRAGSHRRAQARASDRRASTSSPRRSPTRASSEIELAGRRLGQAGNVERDLLDQARLHLGDAGDRGDARLDRRAGALATRANTSGIRRLRVVRAARALERRVRRQQRDDSSRCRRRSPSRSRAAATACIESSRSSLRSSALTTAAPRRWPALRSRASPSTRPSPNTTTRSAMRGDRRVVGDHRGGGAELAVDRARAPRARRVPVSMSSAPVGSSHSSTLGPLGDGARDRDALLLAAGELRRKVIEAVAEADQRERLARASSAARRCR